MKPFLLLCAALLFIAILNLPIGYYTLLRIIISIGALLVILAVYKDQNKMWVIVFAGIGILFNPLIPVYFHDKDIWVPIDIAAGIVFIIKALTTKKEQL